MAWIFVDLDNWLIHLILSYAAGTKKARSLKPTSCGLFLIHVNVYIGKQITLLLLFFILKSGQEEQLLIGVNVSLVGDNKKMAEMYAVSETADITSAQIYWSKPVMKPNLL